MPKPSQRERRRKLDKIARDSLYGQLEGRNLVAEIDQAITTIVDLAGGDTPTTRSELDWIKLQIEAQKVKLTNLQKFLDKILPNKQATEIEQEVVVTPEDRLVANEMGVAPEEVAAMRTSGQAVMALVGS